MKTEIIPYEPIHAFEILDKYVREQDAHLRSAGDWEETANGWKVYGPSFTLMIDEEPIACAGVTILRKGVGEAWSLLSTRFYDHKLTVYKNMKRGLNKIIVENDLRRVQALVFQGFEKGCHFLVHLGFKNETPEGMKKCGPNGETVLLFGRT